MGRYPELRSVVDEYLSKRAKMNLGKGTLDNERRILTHITKGMEELHSRGTLKVISPCRWGEREVLTFLRWMEGRGLQTDTQEKYLSFMERVLVHARNPIVQIMRDDGVAFPRRIRKEIKVLQQDEIEDIRAVAPSIRGSMGEPETWRAAKASFLVSMYLATGLRPSELRMAQLEDLNLRRWRLKVRHPKGEGRYGVQRTVLILPEYRAEVERFLEERDSYVKATGLDRATFLIPNLRAGKDGHYSSNHFRELKKELQEASGVEFRLKDFRSTYATTITAEDSSLLNDVSVMLGHSSTKTTQTFYARMSSDVSASRIEKAMTERAAERGESSKAADPEKAEFGGKFEITGYN